MGNVDVNAISGALATIFDDKIAYQFNRAVVLSQVLPFLEGTSKNIQWDAEFGSDPSGSVIADGAPVTVFNDDSLVPAVLQWGTYSEAFAVTGKALSIAAATKNPAELASLFAEKIDRAVMRLARAVNFDWYTGTGALNHIQGMTGTNGALKATGTYAGIDRGTWPQWAGNELSAGGTARPLNVNLMRDMMTLIYTSSGEAIDLIVCDANQHEKYGLTFGPNRRYVDQINLRGQTIRLDAGYKALEFDGIPVLRDATCPAGTMFFLNTNHIRIRQLPDITDSMVPNHTGGSVQLHGTAETQLNQTTTQLKARINPLAVLGDLYGFQLIMYPQLQVTKPNRHGILGDLE